MTQQYNLTDGGLSLAYALLTELGLDATDDNVEALCGNHAPSLINLAALGDVPALVELRTAMGLPLTR